MKIKIARLDSNSDDIPLPKYVTSGAAGMDVYAAVQKRVVISPGKTVLIPTGFSIELPAGFEAQIRPRSGLAIKYNVGLLNSPGTIDSDYRGEIRIVMTNFGRKRFIVQRGDRIAQMIIARYVRAGWKEVKRLSQSKRGEGGFGHTGK
jgi:dUTP pyrophosphatase